MLNQKILRYIITGFSLLPAAAAPPDFKTVLYGASYYHEYMPYERLDRDVELMVKAGISVVRVGESTWTSFEPQEGRFEFAWMERILDRMHKAGIQVILGTPTYSLPPWLYRKHPELLVTYLGGAKAQYGIRQNMDISHPTYRMYSERIINQVVGHFRNHPAVIGYQIDNETSSYGTAGRNVQLSFVDHLKAKFKTTAELNRLWGFVYWGQLVNDWDELPPRDGILNPGYKLEWERFQQSLTTDFLAWQAGLVNKLKRPDQFVTQDFVGGIPGNVNSYQIARRLDVVSTNPYHAVQDELDGEQLSFTGDYNRALKQANYLVTETNAQTTGWDSKGQFPPYDGQIRLSVYSNVAAGANLVAYWHWHSLHYGQETYWKGVLSHDLEPNRAYAEVTKVAQELRRHGPRLANFKPKAEVALLYSSDSQHGLRFMPFDDKVDYMAVLRQMYRALYQLNAGVDIVTPENIDFARYKLVVIPPLYVAGDTLLERIDAYVNRGGHVLMAFKSGFANEHSTVRWAMAPGPLRKACGFRYQEFSNLKKALPLQGDPFQAGAENRVSVWADLLIPETAGVVATYDHPFYGKYPAITRNRYGRGTLTYQGTVLSAELQRKLMLESLKTAGLLGGDQALPASVKVRHGASNAGKQMHYYMNFSGERQAFAYPYGSGSDVLGGRKVEKAGRITLGPWDLIIIEEL